MASAPPPSPASGPTNPQAQPRPSAVRAGGPSGPPPSGPIPPTPAPATNGVARPPGHAHPPSATQPATTTSKTAAPAKKKPEPPDPLAMYESVKNRIAALESEEVHGEEEDRKLTDEARKSIKGDSESAIQQKYIELFAEMKRLERDHAKEKQKLTKDKDAAKSQLTKANSGRTKLENLARELQKDNKKLREDGKRLSSSIDEVQEELAHMKNQVERRTAAIIKKRDPPRTGPGGGPPTDLVVKVVCKYRAELFFKISRKTKLSRLFNAWTERMCAAEEAALTGQTASTASAVSGADGVPKDPPQTVAAKGKKKDAPAMSFLFTHMGRGLEPDMTPEEVGMEDGDEILAVEMMDLTTPELDPVIEEPRRQLLKKNWTENPTEARKAVEDMFDGVVRERLKDILRQYELREKHFDCVIRSKELEVLLARARTDEAKQVSEGERQIASVAEAQNQQLRQQMEEMQNSQAKLMDKLIACCKEPTGERTQKLFAFLREELERRGTKVSDITPGSPGVD